MDVIKDIWDGLTQRLRSPIFGSVLLSFVAFNWKEIGFVFYGEGTLAWRYAYWDKNTDVWSLVVCPLFTGISIALALPFVRFAGGWVSSWPLSKLRALEEDGARKQRIAQLKARQEEDKAAAAAELEKIKATTEMEAAVAQLQAEREREKIDAEKRLKDAQGISEKLGEELAKRREEGKKEPKQKTVTPSELAILQLLSDKSHPTKDRYKPHKSLSTKDLDTFSETLSNSSTSNISRTRAGVEFDATIESMIEAKLVDVEEFYQQYEGTTYSLGLSQSGYRELDRALHAMSLPQT